MLGDETALVSFKYIESDFPHQGKILGRHSRSFSLPILAERHVEHPVQGVLHTPEVADVPYEVGLVAWAADVPTGLCRFLLRDSIPPDRCEFDDGLQPFLFVVLPYPHSGLVHIAGACLHTAVSLVLLLVFRRRPDFLLHQCTS